MNSRLILCGGAPGPRDAENPVRLSIAGPDANVRVEIDDISRQMVSAIPDTLLDLLEISAYIYSADQTASRGGDGTRHLGNNWRRFFDFHIPVRNPDLWGSKEVTQKLASTLNFLADDNYSFTFSKLCNNQPTEQYFKLAKNNIPTQIDEVVLFSGGLDSLAGAVDEIVTNGKRVALVSHRSNSKTHFGQAALAKDLRSYTKTPFIHVPIWAHKGSSLTKEYTQRTRSLLFASLGTVVASLLDLRRIRFYENGVMSLNLPISEQIIGSRATRTTHPATLAAFSDLFSTILGKKFEVENPFTWKTKTDIVKVISDAGCGELIRHSSSCTHTWERDKLKTHCGVCSQCVDRRFAVLASGNEQNDPAEMYSTDFFTGARKPGVDVTLLESYIRTAADIEKMSEAEFFTRFQELNRALPYLNGTESAKKVLELYKRHAQQVSGVVRNGIIQYRKEIETGGLPDSSLIKLALPDSRNFPEKLEPSIIPPQRPFLPTTSSWNTGITYLITTAPYCTVISRPSKGKPTTKTMSRAEYISMAKGKTQFDMFVDGVTYEATRRTVKGRHLTDKLTPSEYEILREYMETPTAIRPSNTDTGKTLNSQTAAIKLFEAARRKADINTKRYEYRSFKTHKTVSAKMKSYEFAPPDDLGYCLVKLTPQ